MEKFAIISQVSEADLPMANLEKLAKALTFQAQSHLLPYHAVSGTFEVRKDLPNGYIPFFIQYDINSPNQAGYHWVENGIPYVRVKFTRDFDQLCLTCSHEALETIVNPQIKKFGQGQDFAILNRRGAEMFEICDICQTKEFAYRIDGVMVSNFVTPNYYDTVTKKGLRYDYLGLVSQAGEILEGGYKSFKISDTEYLQAFKTKGVLTWKLLTGNKTVELTANSNPFTWLAPTLGSALILVLYFIFRKK